MVKKLNNNVFRHQAYCINCVKQDQFCTECKQVVNTNSTTIDQNTIYCIIEKGELHEMKIMRSVKDSKTRTFKATAKSSATVTITQ